MIASLLRPQTPRVAARSFLLAAARSLLLAALAATALPALAQETVCARVKIEIKQELTLERQAFDAEMRINNTTDTGVIENVSVVVKITDENGTAGGGERQPQRCLGQVLCAGLGQAGDRRHRRHGHGQPRGRFNRHGGLSGLTWATSGGRSRSRGRENAVEVVASRILRGPVPACRRNAGLVRKTAIRGCGRRVRDIVSRPRAS
ncbi:MAG: hypothetical protein RR784_10815 [Burkholderiaceae bacterium]